MSSTMCPALLWVVPITKSWSPCFFSTDQIYAPPSRAQIACGKLTQSSSSLATGLLWTVTSNSHHFLHLPPDLFLLLYLVCFQKSFSLVASPLKYFHVILCHALESQMIHTMGAERVIALAIASGCTRLLRACVGSGQFHSVLSHPRGK